MVLHVEEGVIVRYFDHLEGVIQRLMNDGQVQKPGGKKTNMTEVVKIEPGCGGSGPSSRQNKARALERFATAEFCRFFPPVVV